MLFEVNSKNLRFVLVIFYSRTSNKTIMSLHYNLLPLKNNCNND